MIDFAGRVVVVHAFQMLCPGCVLHGIPQAMKIRSCFDEVDVAVLGLHTVFEYHHAMGREVLEMFVHDYGIAFPVGIDKEVVNSDGPLTMATYGLEGAPSLLIFDKAGHLRLNHFGIIEDMIIGAVIGRLLVES